MSKLWFERSQTLALAVLAFVLVTLLSGCRDAGLNELQITLNEGGAALNTVSDAVPGEVEPAALSEPPVGYLFDDRRSPFVTPGTPPEVAATEHFDMTPNDGRSAEPLEAFALDELRLVGTLTFNGRTSALVRDPAGKVHQLSIGSRMGADFGRITGITASAVQLVETVPASSGWIERASTLVLGD
ncbi:MAG: pilus assembly protein PilP [Halomonas sp.]|uniref:pilus assembly protein PilP n=1 Tax=Halomonas sp. TaxID=1486246 RepID=UPI003F939B33